MSVRLVVLGAGPAGYSAASRAASLGMKVTLVEARAAGGVCLNEGCIPTKALLAGASLYDRILGKAGGFGIETAGATIDVERLHARKAKVVSSLVSSLERLFAKRGVEYLRGRASFAGPRSISVELEEGGGLRLDPEYVLVACGSEPIVLEGLEPDGGLVWDSSLALSVPRVPSRIVVVGGGVIGCEFASFYSMCGASVTIVELTEHLLPAADDWVGRQIESAFRRRGIGLALGRKVERLRKGDADVEVLLDDGSTIECEVVLVAVGRRPCPDAVNAPAGGIELERGAVVVDGRMRTSVDGVYAAGDVTGGMQLAHLAAAQGVAAVEDIAVREGLLEDSERSYPGDSSEWVVPSAVFCVPEVGMVGATERSLKESGVEYRSVRIPWGVSGRALAMGDVSGGVKLLASPEGRLLGVHIVGGDACELIGAAALAMSSGLDAGALASTVMAHPTLSELLKEAAESLEGKSIHL